MAAILKFRRGDNTDLSSITLQIAEPFFNTSKNTLQLGDGSNTITLVRMDSVNTGSLNLTGDLTASNATLSGDIRIGGNIYLGDQIANDNININASFSGSLIPSASNEYDLGSPSKYWRNAYLTSASVLDISVPGSGIVSSSQQISDYNVFLEINGDNVFSGSSQVNADSITNFDSNVKDKMNADDVISGSSQLTTEFDARYLNTNGDSVISSSAQLTTEFDTRYLNTEGDSVISSSAQLTTEFDSRYLNTNSDSVISSSAQLTTEFDSRYLNTNGDGVFSGSQQVNADSITNFDSNVKDKMNADGVISGSTQLEGAFLEINGDSVVSSSAQISGYNTFLEINGDGIVSGSSQIDHDSTTGFVGNEHIDHSSVDITAGDGLTGGGDITTTRTLNIASANNGIVVNPNDIQLDTASTTFRDGVKSKINGDGVVSGSVQVTISETTGYTSFSSSLDSRLDTLEGPFSTSVDSRLDSLETDSHTHSNKAQLDVINQNLSTTSDVTFNTGSFTGDVTVTGDLTVLGSATEIQTSELRIQDKLITVASGSADSAAADGAGLEVDGANKSIKWNHGTQQFVFDAQISSSVGFKGDGSQITGVTATGVQFADILSKPTLVSGSDQVSGSIYGDISGDIGINNLGVASISSGVIVNDDVKSDAAILHSKLNLKGSGIVTGSDQISASLFSDVTGDGIISSVGVLEIGAGVIDNDNISNSAAISYQKINFNRSDIISGSAQISSLNTFLEINGDGVFSGSSQVNADSITNFDANVKTKLDDEGVISGSAQLTTEFDTRYLNTGGDNVVSSSQQISDYNEFLEINGDNVVSSSAQISGYSVFLEKNGDSVISSSAQLTTEFDARYINTDADGVISGSSQLTSSYDTRYEPIANGTNTLISSSAFSSANQGTLNTSINGVNGTVDLGLQITDAPTFVSASFSNLAAAGSSVNAALVIDASDGSKTKTRTLGTAAFLNVSASVGDDPNSIPTNQAVNDALIAAGAGDLTELNPTNTFSPEDTGLIHLSSGTQIGGVRGVQGNIHIQIATGSGHFTEGVTKALPNGLVSQSSQLYTDLDARYVTDLGEGAITSSAQVDGTAIQNNTINIAGNSTALGGSVSLSDITDGTGIVSGSSQIDVTSTTNYSSINQYSNTKVLNYINDLGVISGSSQVNANTITNFDSNVKDKLNAEGVISSSAQIEGNFLEVNGDNVVSSSAQVITHLNGTGIVSGSSQLENVFLEINGDGVVSGSAQINSLIVGTSFSSSIDSRVVNLEAETHENPLTFNDTTTISFNRAGDTLTAKAIGGIVSQSSQLYTDLDARYATDLGESVVTSSAQIDHNQTTNYTASRHIDHSSVSIGSGKGLTGGGTIEVSRSLTLATGSSHFLDGVKDKLNAEDVISSSAQLHTEFDTRYLNTNGDGVISGSSQVSLGGFSTTDLSEGTNLYYTDARVKTKLNVEGVLSGSSQVSLGGDVTGGANANTVEKVQGVSITSDEATQIANINGNTISEVQWGYVGQLNQNLRTSDDVTFASASLSNVTISGNLIVLGDATEIATSELRIQDKVITVASGSADSAAANGAGIEIAGANESITWDHGNSRFNISDDTHVVGNLTATADVVAYASSDKRLKNDIQPIENSLEKINKISGNSFVWDEEKQNTYKGKDYGVIAQEIEEILPELVNTREDGYKAVKYDRIVSLLIEGIKELSNEVNDLKNKLG